MGTPCRIVLNSGKLCITLLSHCLTIRLQYVILPRMIKHILLMTLLLVPTHASAHDWNYDTWAIRTATIDNELADCFMYLRDEEFEPFRASCDIHDLATQHYAAISEYHTHKFMSHPIMSDTEYFIEHLPPVLGPIVARNFLMTSTIDMAIMTLYLAEQIYMVEKP